MRLVWSGHNFTFVMAASFGPDELPPGAWKLRGADCWLVGSRSRCGCAKAGWNCWISCNSADPEWSNSVMVCIELGRVLTKQNLSWEMLPQHRWLNDSITWRSCKKDPFKEFGGDFSHLGFCICGGLCFRLDLPNTMPNSFPSLFDVKHNEVIIEKLRRKGKEWWSTNLWMQVCQPLFQR